MGIAKRLATETTGVDTAPGVGPKRVALNDAGTKTSRSAFGTGPADVITQESEFHTEASGRFDARGSGQVLITLVDAAGADTFTLTATLDGTLVGTTSALNDDETAANVQAALRSVLAGTDLTVAAGSNGGPFTVTFNDDEFYSRHFPTITGTGTGCTVVVTRVADPAVKRYLGETKYESTTELVGPTIGDITVTDAIDEVQTLSFSAGTDGGDFSLQFRNGRTGIHDWDFELPVLAAEIDNVFEQRTTTSAADAPTVRWAVPLVLEVEFVDWDTTDDAILTYDTTDASDSIEFATVDAGASAAAREAIIVAWVKTINAFASGDVTAAEVTENFKYNVTFHDGPRGLANGDFALAVTGTTNEDATPDQITAADPEAGVAFTFENGQFAGKPIRGGIFIATDTLEDGGVDEPATMTVTTAGVLGSASAAYTEQTTVGDSVFGEAVNDATGVGYSAQKDADSPAVFTGLPTGTYTLVLRTVADLALSSPSTKAFTVASA